MKGSKSRRSMPTMYNNDMATEIERIDKSSFKNSFFE